MGGQLPKRPDRISTIGNGLEITDSADSKRAGAGWNIIGHTPLRIFDPDRPDEGMFWLKPGDRVKFVPVA